MMLQQGHIGESDRQIIKRFYIALIIMEISNGIDIYSVSRKYNMNTDFINRILSSVSSNAFRVLKFCDFMDEYWVFGAILKEFCSRFNHYCSSSELVPLMELPNVKIVSANFFKYILSFSQTNIINRHVQK